MTSHADSLHGGFWWNDDYLYTMVILCQRSNVLMTWGAGTYEKGAPASPWLLILLFLTFDLDLISHITSTLGQVKFDTHIILYTFVTLGFPSWTPFFLAYLAAQWAVFHIEL